jgi:signal transduction histidine kinase
MRHVDELDPDRIQQLERLAAIGQVAGGVVHELRQPLSAIQTSVYYLLNAPSPSPEKIAEHLERIEHQVGVADRTIEAISGFAKLTRAELEAVAVEQLLAEALERNPMPSGIEVSVSAAGLPPILADAGQLHLALANLLRNASEAMAQGGRLSITARREGECVSIAVADTGTGISPEILVRIMEPLYTTKAGGLGLGLALACAILERHGSTLCVASELGSGSTFSFSIRAATQPA